MISQIVLYSICPYIQRLVSYASRHYGLPRQRGLAKAELARDGIVFDGLLSSFDLIFRKSSSSSAVPSTHRSGRNFARNESDPCGRDATE